MELAANVSDATEGDSAEKGANTEGEGVEVGPEGLLLLLSLDLAEDLGCVREARREGGEYRTFAEYFSLSLGSRIHLRVRILARKSSKEMTPSLSTSRVLKN